MHIFGRTSTQTWADELLSVISRMADPTNVLITIFNLLLLRHNVQYNANSLLFTTLSSHLGLAAFKVFAAFVSDFAVALIYSYVNASFMFYEVC